MLCGAGDAGTQVLMARVALVSAVMSAGKYTGNHWKGA